VDGFPFPADRFPVSADGFPASAGGFPASAGGFAVSVDGFAVPADGCLGQAALAALPLAAGFAVPADGCLGQAALAAGFAVSVDGFAVPADGCLGQAALAVPPLAAGFAVPAGGSSGRGALAAPLLAAGFPAAAGLPVASSQTWPDGRTGAGPGAGAGAGAGRGRACRPAATAASNADIASCITTPTASAAAATPELSPGPDSRSRRLARQIGHQAHSGASSYSEVAASHTSAVGGRPPPSAVRIWPRSCRVTLRAPERTSQRWSSPTGSLPCCLAGSVTCCLPSLLCPGGYCVLSAPAARRPSTRAFSPFSAVSMIVFSARRFSMPGNGTRTSTLSS